MKKSVKPVNTRMLVNLGLLSAIEIVLTRFCNIPLTPTMWLNFGFLPIAVAAVLYGPIPAGTAYAVCDILGALLFPKGAYLPGLTLTAFLIGLTYGLFLHNFNKNWIKLLSAVLITAIALDLGVKTIFLLPIYDKGYIVLFWERTLKCAVMIPIQTVLIWFVVDRLTPMLRRFTKTGDS